MPFLALLVCKFRVFGGLFACLIFLMFFCCFNIYFWSLSTTKNKLFVRDVFQISQVVRVLSSSPLAIVFVTVFGTKFGSFWSYVSMLWHYLFFTLLSMRFGTLFGAPNVPKNRRPILPQVLILAFRVSDDRPESFLTLPGDHFGCFGVAFLINFGCPGDHFGKFRAASFKHLAIERILPRSTWGRDSFRLRVFPHCDNISYAMGRLEQDTPMLLAFFSQRQT